MDVTVGQADTYFLTRINSNGWEKLASDTATKTAYLVTARKQLETSYTLDLDLEKHRDAVCEQAHFLMVGGGGVDMRQALTTMGLIETGVNDEKFAPKDCLFICAHAKMALRGAELPRQRVYANLLEMTREED